MVSEAQALIDCLKKGEFITSAQLEEAEQMAQKQNRPVEHLLVELGFFKDEELGQIMADLHHWKFVDLRKEPIDEAVLRTIPESVATNQKVIAFARTENGVKVAMNNPSDTTLIHLLSKRLNAPIGVHFATENDIRSSLHHYQKEISGKFEKLLEAHAKEAIGGKAKDSAVVRIVDLLLSHGYENKASDIHVEPQDQQSTVRFRIDGVLHDIVSIPADLHDLIVTRVKIMAKLRTDEHQSPQDGKLEYEFEQEKADIRVSIVPTVKGENLVMRLLSQKSRQFSLEDIGLSSHDHELLKKNISEPWGMILVTGPTGSGKTTTLYSILKILNRREVKISTIEDPVEYNIEGISQIQVNPKGNLTFASGLRSIVRQDPDIIMVGEIRDQETAEIAVNSAMTGHLVLSTLHTNDAATTLPRLLDMGIEPFLIASTVNVAVGQRLVRKVCHKCIYSYEVDVKEIQGKLPDVVLQRLTLGRDKILLYRGKGCTLCQNTGYLGRIGIFEVLEMTDEIRRLIMENADADRIKEKAVEQGMTTMFEDAIEKILNGITTVEEVLRVIKL